MIYISGPMSGKPYFNIPMFDRAKEILTSKGHRVISPPDEDTPAMRKACLECHTGDWFDLPESITSNSSYGEILGEDIKTILDGAHITGLALLPGWGHSKGATMEVLAAALLGKKFYMLNIPEACELSTTRVLVEEVREKFGEIVEVPNTHVPLMISSVVDDMAKDNYPVSPAELDPEYTGVLQ